MDGQAGHVDGLLVFSGDRKIITRRSNVSVERPTFLTGKPYPTGTVGPRLGIFLAIIFLT